MTLTLASLAVVALVVAFVCWRVGIGPRVIPWAMLVAGAGVAGLAGDLITRATSGGLAVFERGTALLFGVGVGVALVVGVGLSLVARMKPKGKGPSKLTALFAFAFPSLLVAVGFGAIVSAAGSGATTLANALADLVAGIGESF